MDSMNKDLKPANIGVHQSLSYRVKSLCEPQILFVEASKHS